MKFLYILLFVILLAIVLTILASYICFRMAFYVPKKKPKCTEEYDLPKGKIYEPYHEQMIAWTKESRTFPQERFTITSFDGLKLSAKYFEYAPDAPIELMFHGYRGNAERDLSGAVQRCFSLGRSVVIVDQRTSGQSEGNVISFGINERRDCLAWVNFLVEHFGKDVKIILTGISMGASTVMMATALDLPPNVVSALADCGYTSAKEIIQKVMREMHLPPNLLYPFVKLGAKLFGHFDLEETSPIEAMKNCHIPIIFIHGETDDFVPCDMSRANYEACVAPKRIFTVADAGHGMSYLLDNDGYFNALKEFSEQYQ